MAFLAPETRVPVVAEPLTQAAFALFGQVIDLAGAGGRAVNEGRGRRRDLPDLAHGAQASRRRLAIYDILPSPTPVTVCVFERHPLSAQLFAPMSPGGFLVVVAPEDDAGHPDLDGLRAFVGRGDQTVIYGVGVWHAPLVALEAPGRFLMGQWESGCALDCVETSASLTVTVPAGAEAA